MKTRLNLEEVFKVIATKRLPTGVTPELIEALKQAAKKRPERVLRDPVSAIEDIVVNLTSFISDLAEEVYDMENDLYTNPRILETQHQFAQKDLKKLEKILASVKDKKMVKSLSPDLQAAQQELENITKEKNDVEKIRKRLTKTYGLV